MCQFLEYQARYLVYKGSILYQFARAAITKCRLGGFNNGNFSHSSGAVCPRSRCW